MTTNEESMEKEANVGDDSQINDFISMSIFDLLQWILKIFCSPLLLYILLFYDIDVALDLAWEGKLLEMESEEKIYPVSQ